MIVRKSVVGVVLALATVGAVSACGGAAPTFPIPCPSYGHVQCPSTPTNAPTTTTPSASMLTYQVGQPFTISYTPHVNREGLPNTTVLSYRIIVTSVTTRTTIDPILNPPLVYGPSGPAVGNKYVIVKWSGTNTGTNNQSLDFSAASTITVNNLSYSPTSGANALALDYAATVTNTATYGLNPGQSGPGWIVFEIPLSSTPTKLVLDTGEQTPSISIAL